MKVLVNESEQSSQKILLILLGDSWIAVDLIQFKIFTVIKTNI